MIKEFSKKVACSLCENTENNNRVEIFEYAVYITINSTIHIISTIALGLLFNVLLESVIFYLSFILVRKFTGGYHAKTPLRCYMFSICTITFFMLLIKGVIMINLHQITWVILLLAFASVILITLYAPLESVNNLPLSQKERDTYNKVAVISAIAILFVATYLTIMNLDFIAVPMAMSLIMIGVVIVLARVIKD